MSDDDAFHNVDILFSASCPGGSYSVGSCANTGSCATGYSCVQGSCCPSYNSQPSIAIAICPGGGSGVGNCVNSQCATGYQCVQNQCCPSTTTTNPFVCPDGTQAAGGCVNGLCGTGYTCRNGLCCAGAAVNSIKCLDGSEAVGACISSCQSNGCGGSTPTYYCGTGYTCTTGNICCAVNSCPSGGTAIGQTVNGLCPAGSTANNGICCSNACPDGTAGSSPVGGICPTGLTLLNGVCCSGTGANPLGVCDVIEQENGPCINGQCPTPGFACDATGANCCPVQGFPFSDPNCQLGPAIDGLCPAGYVAVFDPNFNGGAQVCADLQCVPGVCDEAVQAGPCQDGGCQAGFTCFTLADICCPTPTRRFNKLVNGRGRGISRPHYGQPLHSYMPAHQNHAAAPQHAGTQLLSPLPLCSDGTPSVGTCINGLCGVGLVCDNNQCCRPGNGKDIRSQ
ncbi:hypothetical protein WR25_16040 isoform B [Diploscapter pachys]|uniref:CC domain-containing protein n=1 Tax=Diploscapter pachys TaxID=2018661 RepID=A0A2A2JAD6_9BILA|nr:hypothetical protein WR25_16040 isoform A [Diploscapter pachys]PAV58617.1 hypothetical protein WR25_16040 isoform B [Diploscapter pachys]